MLFLKSSIGGQLPFFDFEVHVMLPFSKIWAQKWPKIAIKVKIGQNCSRRRRRQEKFEKKAFWANLGLEPANIRSQGRNANHYTTKASFSFNLNQFNPLHRLEPNLLPQDIRSECFAHKNYEIGNSRFSMS